MSKAWPVSSASPFFSSLHEKTSSDKKALFQRGFPGSWLVWSSAEVKHKHVSPENPPCSMHFTVTKEEEIISIDSSSPPPQREMVAHSYPCNTHLSSGPCPCLHITPQPCRWQRHPTYSFHHTLQTPPDFLSWNSQHMSAELLESPARCTFPWAVQRQVSSRLYATLWALVSFLCAVGLCRSSKFMDTPAAVYSLCTILANLSYKDA